MIYSIQDDGFDFQRLDLMLDDIVDFRPAAVSEDEVLDFCQLNTQLAPWWPAVETEFVADNPDAPIPDISKWIDSSLVLSPKAYRFLGELLVGSGELLPVSIGAETFYIFNCHTFGEVDESLSEKEYYEGEEVGVKQLVFNHTDVAEKLIFKTRYNACIEIYCTERFKNLVEDIGLTGIDFEPV